MIKGPRLCDRGAGAGTASTPPAPPAPPPLPADRPQAHPHRSTAGAARTRPFPTHQRQVRRAAAGSCLTAAAARRGAGGWPGGGPAQPSNGAAPVRPARHRGRHRAPLAATAAGHPLLLPAPIFGKHAGTAAHSLGEASGLGRWAPHNGVTAPGPSCAADRTWQGRGCVAAPSQGRQQSQPGTGKPPAAPERVGCALSRVDIIFAAPTIGRPRSPTICLILARVPLHCFPRPPRCKTRRRAPHTPTQRFRFDPSLPRGPRAFGWAYSTRSLRCARRARGATAIRTFPLRAPAAAIRAMTTHASMAPRWHLPC